ncbi:MAG: AraC family transcriptional regulator [Saonia sp.]
MREIKVYSTKEDEILKEVNTCLKGSLTQEWGEHVLEFDNDLGKGKIRSMMFDWGVSLLDFDVEFREEVKMTFEIGAISPIEFVFISEGSLRYNVKEDQDDTHLERYQNIIISPEKFSKKRYVFPKGVNVKVNFIRIIRTAYFQKRNHNLNYLNDILLSVFKDENSKLPYKHTGNFNLKIADEVRQLNSSPDSGLIRTLSLEGRLYLILAMQLMEHHKFENQEILPESLSKEDIKKIHQLSEFILDNISDPLTVLTLSEVSGISPKKLQLGFKVLYSKSVNAYIRQLKLEIARDYLKNTELTVSEIVYKIGIRSRSYFSKIFMENYGILPTEYRKKLVKKSL